MILNLNPLKIGELTARVPVVQGGMGVGISLSGLAAAVAAAGGIGTISAAQIGFRDPDYHKNPLETNLRILKEEIGQVFVKVLEDAGVYKCDEEGRKAFDRFIASL